MTITDSTKYNPTVKLKTGASFVKIRPYFSYDTRNILLAAGNDIKVLSTASGECIRRLVGHQSPVIGLQTNPLNHTQLISCSRDGTIITWDYQDGIALKTFKIKGDEDVVAFYAPSKTRRTFVIQYERERNGFILKSAYLKQNVVSTRFVMKNILPSEHAVAFGVQGELVASINEQSLVVFDLAKGVTNRHLTQTRLVCVSCHPSTYVVATADETGRILVWSNIFDRSNLCRSVYHWHSLPVADLCFSSEGCYLYSGGGECVLVKWNLQRENREFLPRLGMPICHLITASNNAFVAVSHADNAVSLVSPELKVVQYIQGLSQGHPWCCPGQQLASTGLLHDPRTGALVLSGRPGHLQFYSLKHDKQLYSVDIVGQNFLTQERNKIIYNTQVEKAAIDSTGLWMSTVQCYDDGQNSLDIVLKVWKYNGSLQTYSLNTTVILPHYKKVSCMRFSPADGKNSPFFVTTSEDQSFKTWVLQTTVEGNTSIESWSCESRGHYRDQNPTEISFKQDGSLLAVAFCWTITLWTPSPLTLSATLSHPTNSIQLRQVFFGRDTCSHLLVSRSDDCLSVWDTMQHKRCWEAQLSTTHMAADPLSEYLAVFSQDHTLFIFKPTSANPCFIKDRVSCSDIFASAFIPHAGLEETIDRMEWQQKSQLYFLNKEQELLTLVDSKDDTEDIKTEGVEEENVSDLRVHTGTNFAVLMAQHKSSGLKDIENKEHFTSSGRLGSKQVKELLEIPSHGLPSLRNICSQFMSALLIPKSTPVS